MTIEAIYEGAEKLINQLITKESDAQGHYLSGKMTDSLDHKSKKAGKADLMEGFAVYYTKFVNDGVPPKSASFKQVPFLIQYFQKRGLPEKEAKSAAFATVKTWMKEGMSTQASKRFSSTGGRQNFVESAITGNEDKIDGYMTNAFDFSIDEAYHKEKSETI